MDNSTTSWAPRATLVVCGWLLAAAAAAGAVATGLSGDRAGLLLLGVCAVAFAGFAALGTLLRPKLAADREGLRIRTLGGTRRLEWSQTRTRLVATRRLGRDMYTLEVESGQQLHVLGWVELGADPRDVADELHALATDA